MDSYDRYTILQNDLQERPYFFLGAGQKLTRSYKGSRTTVETDLPLEKHYQKKIIFVGTGKTEFLGALNAPVSSFRC